MMFKDQVESLDLRKDQEGQDLVILEEVVREDRVNLGVIFLKCLPIQSQLK